MKKNLLNGICIFLSGAAVVLVLGFAQTVSVNLQNSASITGATIAGSTLTTATITNPTITSPTITGGSWVAGGNTVTFTNAAGSAFKVIINASTNGITCVAQ